MTKQKWSFRFRPTIRELKKMIAIVFPQPVGKKRDLPSALIPTPQLVSMARIVEAVEADDERGFCIECGVEQWGCEPDMRDGECEACGCDAVFGASELLIMRVA